jgi:hypothetical protein
LNKSRRAWCPAVFYCPGAGRKRRRQARPSIRSACIQARWSMKALMTGRFTVTGKVKLISTPRQYLTGDSFWRLYFAKK